MPDSDYTRTPPTPSEMQVMAIGDKVSDLCKTVERLSDKMEDIPLKLDRLSTSIENQSRENAKTRDDLERTRNNFEQDIEKIRTDIFSHIGKMETDATLRELKLEKTLEPLIKSETKVSLILAIVAGSGIFILGLVFTAWNTMSSRVDANTSRGILTEKSVESAARERDQLAQRVKDIEDYQRNADKTRYGWNEYETNR